MVRFSRRGERVTDFERQLVAECGAAQLTEAKTLWLELARRIGVEALACVFDEVGGEKMHMPTRENFFRALYHQQRNAEIIRRLACGDSAELIGTDLGLTARMVRYIGRGSVSDDVALDGVIEAGHE